MLASHTSLSDPAFRDSAASLAAQLRHAGVGPTQNQEPSVGALIHRRFLASRDCDRIMFLSTSGITRIVMLRASIAAIEMA
jgi:hypothetical protein